MGKSRENFCGPIPVRKALITDLAHGAFLKK